MHGAGPAADGRSRASPDKAAESTKKARLDLPDGHVKVDMARGGDGCAIVAAYGPREELAVRIDKRLLHCLLCTVPFKAPVFQVPLFLSFLSSSIGAGERSILSC
ncbi:unnamed protein product [Triticum turgidum subsp. durum]|uniref:Uncharacterized protein n=1 Tax=Triticum turgidum subsp. durum TaxID=4567 RepID=A0A9R1RW84_TRITD|nr:unnamed protein product [Triticum turgidum subsp. durum]